MSKKCVKVMRFQGIMLTSISSVQATCFPPIQATCFPPIQATCFPPIQATCFSRSLQAQSVKIAGSVCSLSLSKLGPAF